MGVPSGILTAEGLTTVASVLLGFGFSGAAIGLAVACAASEAEDWVEMGVLAEVGCRVSELCDCCTSCAATLLQFRKCTAVKGSSENASVAEVKRFILSKGLPVGLELRHPGCKASAVTKGSENKNAWRCRHASVRSLVSWISGWPSFVCL